MDLQQLPPEIVTHLDDLAHRLVLPDFDLLLVGDGSGTVYHRPAGWACVAYDRLKRLAVLHTGAVSGGTNNLAELFPYVQALWHHQQNHDQAVSAPVRVQIVSDSELTVRCGNGRYERRANGSLWAAVDWFEQNGYRLGWRHVRRNSNVWHVLMDRLAGRSRRLLEEALPAMILELTPSPAV